MRLLRRSVASVAVAGAGGAVLTLQWWAVFVALPAVVLALALEGDGDRRD